jgi:predicted nucleotidyltransferase
MSELARSATLDDLKLLLKSFNDNGVEYLLIGGYALAAHGYQRATTDIDVVVASGFASGAKVQRALLVLPDQAAKDLQLEWFDEAENIRVADAIVVDVMLNANGETYESLKPYQQTIDLDGVAVKTVSLEGLLLTKRTIRDKDISDRIVIEAGIEALKREALRHR